MLYKHGIIFRVQQCSTMTKHHQSEVASPMGHTCPPQGTSRTIDIKNKEQLCICGIYEHASAYIYWCLHDHRMHVSYADGLRRSTQVHLCLRLLRGQRIIFALTYTYPKLKEPTKGGDQGMQKYSKRI